MSTLDFGTMVQGDLAKTIAPGTVETSTNASYDITGDANTAFTISLPATAVTLKKGNGAGAPTVTVTNFQSYPAGAAGMLNGAGVASLFVGATMNAIPAAQSPGAYTGGFSVTVVY